MSSTAIKLWWHEDSNTFDIALPNGRVIRSLGSADHDLKGAWDEFDLEGPQHDKVGSWALVGEI